jgi:hypothetical protein
MGQAKNRGTDKERALIAFKRDAEKETGYKFDENISIPDLDKFDNNKRCLIASLMEFDILGVPVGANDCANEFIQRLNEFFYKLLNSAEKTLNPSRKVPTYLWFLGEGSEGARCVALNNEFHVGISFKTALSTYNIFLYMMSKKKFLPHIASELEVNDPGALYIPFSMDASWMHMFPRRKPVSDIRKEVALLLALDAFSLVICHEINHLWRAHNAYVKNFSPSEFHMRALEFESDSSAVVTCATYYNYEYCGYVARSMQCELNNDSVGKITNSGYFGNPRSRFKYFYLACFVFFLEQRHVNSPLYPPRNYRACNIFGSLVTASNIENWRFVNFSFEELMSVFQYSLSLAQAFWSETITDSTSDELISPSVLDKEIPKQFQEHAKSLKEIKPLIASLNLAIVRPFFSF